MGRADEQRGRIPEIRASQDTIIFVMTIAEKDGVARKLVVRCEREGEIFASIAIDLVDPKD